MDKVIGYRAVIEVDGFYDAKDWIYRCVAAGIVKCSQCDNPATGVWWNDRAEWYCECAQHRSYEPQWSGSTRWNPSSFGLRVFKDPAEAWMKALPEGERAKVSLRSFDATDYYSLFVEGYWKDQTYHYFRGDARSEGYRCWCKVYPLTNGEFAYELNSGHLHRAGGTSWGYGIRGAWATEALAIEAAKQEAQKRHLLPEESESEGQP
ncbi:MAG: hypothetical protein E6Q97_07205 [Desulfurellales bacterium]|nr:MAG: hypothetical protein E6Q97_07205 [Desulfurellales bacterium]